MIPPRWAPLLLALAGCEWVVIPAERDAYDADGDGFRADIDCDDYNEFAHPLASELCNGTDNNCSGDETDAADALLWYRDLDGDGWGDPGDWLTSCDPPVGYAALPYDCDDVDARVNPAAIETDCEDPKDYNCDGYAAGWDSDLDGYADCVDCDGGDPRIHPGASERCNDFDDDCDGLVDEDLALLEWHPDEDRDGWGNAAEVQLACTRPSGWVADDTDCDDDDPAAHPWAAELCNGLDDDCDGTLDEFDPDGNTRWYLDVDGDGYAGDSDWEASCTPIEGRSDVSDDCDDADPSRHPGAAEVCDRVDQDCDGVVDDGATDAPTWYRDNDGDGWGDEGSTSVSCIAPRGFSGTAGDCDDRARTSYPGATERCGGGDEDCDGAIDEAGATGGSTWYPDADGDGWGSDADALEACSAPAGALAEGGDCDDSSLFVHPGALEVDCSDPTDYNCDGSVGDDDADGDGWPACEDCDDADASLSPAADETCNGVDDDCDASVDEDPIDGTIWNVDADGDGYGAGDEGSTACDPLPGHVANATDCDDTDPAISPGAAETCATAADDDCDGETNLGGVGCTTFYADEDGDGYGGDGACLCAAEAPYTEANDGDCDDADAYVNPGGVEVCGNGLDDDCDDTAVCGIGGEQALADATVLSGAGSSDTFGAAFAFIADRDGDNYAELVVGAPYADTGGLSQGAVYLLEGPITARVGAADAAETWFGSASGDKLGYSVAAGDLDGDGVVDLILGAPGEDSGGPSAGAVYLLRGPMVSSAVSAADATLLGEAANDALGHAAAVTPDSDGDALDELALGVPRESTFSGGAGAVFLYDHAPSGSGTARSSASATITGASVSDSFGRTLASAGDVDGDGLGDLVVGAYGADTAGVGTGSAYLFLGPTAGAHTAADADAERYGATGALLGYAVAGATDTDADGYDDLLVGGINDDTLAINGGGAWLFRGPLTGVSSVSAADASLLGDVASENAGAAVALGDLNDDGLADAAVTGDGTSWGSVGAVYVCFGPLSGTLALGDSDALLLGENTSDATGQPLLIPGDLDFDLYGDLLIGAQNHDDTGADAGAVYFVPGGLGF